MLAVEAAADAVVHDIVKLAVVLHVRLFAMMQYANTADILRRYGAGVMTIMRVGGEVALHVFARA